MSQARGLSAKGVWGDGGGQERQDWHAAIYIWIIGGILQTSLESKFGKGRIKWESKSLSIQLSLVSCSVDPYFGIAGGGGSHLRQEREREREDVEVTLSPLAQSIRQGKERGREEEIDDI